MTVPMIQIGGVEYPATICPTCGGKVYPASSLEAHTDRHKVAALYWDDQILILKGMLDRMRLN
jgi:hypothetical protein